ncbi:hypothetical protein ABN702_22585 [Bacillus haimaensis]|uniref:hypothetical protein n=1 Tax=Bacillus haimaensis TaxID=3160967 RepID=UPI003AA83522
MNNKTLFSLPIMLLLLWVAGCSSSEDRILSHLESTYNEEFEIEHVDEGSWLFPEMYGRDKAIVHPKGNEELVFLSGEYRNNEGEYYDGYVLAKWGEELKASLKSLMEKELPGSPYKVIVYATNESYDASMIAMPFQEFIENNRKEVRLVIVAGVYTDGAPDVESYKESFYNIYQEMQKYGAEQYTIDAGFVEKSEDISDYIRTAGVNNIAWSNLKAKVYGQLNVDERLNPKNPDPDIAEEYILTDSDAIVRIYRPYEE